jgi:transposase
MGKRYIVTLSEEEREKLQSLINKGQTQGYRIRHAQILLALDEKQTKQNWTNDEIRKAYRVNPSTISELAKRFVEEGLEAALGRKEQARRRHKIDGQVEAHIVAIACSEAPEGCERWTLMLIADKLVEQGVVDSISATAVGYTLKKMKLSPGRKSSGAFPKQAQNL